MLAVNRPSAIASAGLLPSPLVAGRPISILLAGSDPDGDALTWSLVGGTRPEGLTLAPNGALTGIPTGAGATFTVRAQDPDGATATRAFTLEVGGAPTFLTAEGLLGSCQVGAPATFAVVAENSVSGALSCVLTGAITLPDSLIMAADGTIEDAPAAGRTTFIVRATNPATGFSSEPIFRRLEEPPAAPAPSTSPPASRQGHPQRFSVRRREPFCPGL